MWIEGRAVYREEADGAVRPVTVALDLRGLTIRDLAGEDVAFWPFGTLARLPGGGREHLLLVSQVDTARIEITDGPAAAAFDAALKAIPKAGDPAVPRAYAAGCVAAAAILAGILAVTFWALSSAAEILAPAVPESIVEAIDAAALPSALASLGASADSRCVAPAGAQALQRLVDRLADAGAARPVSLDVAVYDGPVPNALALPGGTIVLTGALVAAAERPDALAGVIAHEIGHVHHRHGLRAMLHAGGLALAVGMVTGDAGGLAERLLQAVVGAGYSREAEREADRFAVDAVAAAGGDPRALGEFLERLSADAEGGAVASLFASHPMSDERRAAIEARAADRAPRPGRLIDPAGFRALARICEETRGP